MVSMVSSACPVDKIIEEPWGATRRKRKTLDGGASDPVRDGTLKLVTT